MKKNFSKIAALTIALLTAASMTGCGDSNKEPAESPTESPAESSAAPTEAVEDTASDEPVTIKLWHIWTNDVDPQRKVMEAAIEDVKAQMPNVTFEVTANEDEDNKQKLPLALATDDAPDIFYWQGAGNGEKIVQAGDVLDLTPYYEADAELQQKLPKAILNYTTYDGKIYGYPYAKNAALIYCNTELFDKAGLELPATYDDLLTCTEKFKEMGIVPMSVAGADQWPCMFQYASLALKEAGAEVCNKALAGEESFNQESFITAAKQMQELAEKGFYSDSVMAVGYEDAQNAFNNGEAAMFYMGDWANGAFDPNAENPVPVANNVKVIVWPDAGKGFENDRIGGASNAFWASSKTKNPDVTAKVLALLTEAMSKEGYKQGTGVPVYTTATEAPDSQIMKDETELMAKAENYTLWWDTALGTEKGNAVNGYIVSLMSGEITPEDFVTSLDSVVAGK